MPQENLTYAQTSARTQLELIRIILRELPEACGDFIRGIEQTTSTLTRLAYARDLRLFFHFLATEVPEYGGFTPEQWDYTQLDGITARHIHLYMEYVSLYMNENDVEYSNAELGKMRKLSTLRSFFKFLFRNEKISSNVAALVDMPKRHEKPILRLEIDEVARMLDLVENGNALNTDHQKKYNDHTRRRDLAMLTLFLGTGIRVSECVGLNLSDLDFEINGFVITRKGGAQVILYFPEEVAEELKDYVEYRKKLTALPGHEDALFLSLQKKRMGVRAVEKMVKKYALQAAPLKRRISPHKLRSTFGTNLYHETGDIYLVADVLGHSDINTTRRHYAAMSDDRRRLAAQSVVLREKKPTKKPAEEERCK